MRPDDAALRWLTGEQTAAHGLVDPGAGVPRERAVGAVHRVLGPMLHDNGVRVSPLGAAWSSDIDVHVVRRPGAALLLDAGWLPLDPILHRLGSKGRDRWLVVDNGEVLGCADLEQAPPAEAVVTVLRRVRRRGEVRLREVLELCELARAGHELPARDRAIGLAARIEAGHGGSELRRYLDGPPAAGPLPLRRGPTAVLRRLRRLVPRRRRRVVLGLSGVDGAGKSTLTASLLEDLRRAGVPATVVWTRPGMGLEWLRKPTDLIKRLLGQDTAPALRTVAHVGSDAPSSRRGLVGGLWALVVVLCYLVTVRRSHRHSRGVVIYDRHLLDALATVHYAYAGPNLTLHAALIRSLLPRADFSVYLAVTAEVSVARKPDPVFSEHAVRRQLEEYAELLRDMPGVVQLDATRAPEELARSVLRLLLDAG